MFFFYLKIIILRSLKITAYCIGMFAKYRVQVRIIFCDTSFMSYTLSHYENTPMQYTAIFHGCKKDNFQLKNCDGFLIFAQNIDCGYTLDPPQ